MAEEYYDSLEEDSNYGSLESLEEASIQNQLNKTREISKIPVKSRRKVHQKENEADISEEDDIIPFYGHNLSKSEIELKYGSEFDGNKFKTKLRKRKYLPAVNGRLKSNSYLHIFYSRLGVEKLDLTNRATCEDLSPRSYATCKDFDIVSSVEFSEVESTYSCKNANNEELSLSLVSLDSQLCSVSQHNMKLNVIKEDGFKPKKNCIKSRGLKVPELGKLGPEIPKDKLNLLKKRQEYGQKVSQKNKIKMMEKKVLHNLRQEIKECKKTV